MARPLGPARRRRYSRHTASPGAVGRSKPGANHLRARVTPRHARVQARSSIGTRRYQASPAESPRPRSGRRVPLWGGRVSPVVPPHFAVGLSLGLNSAPFKLPPLFPLPSRELHPANVCTPPYPANGNWKSCWVLQPSRVQIPHLSRPARVLGGDGEGVQGIAFPIRAGTGRCSQIVRARMNTIGKGGEPGCLLC